MPAAAPTDPPVTAVTHRAATGPPAGTQLHERPLRSFADRPVPANATDPRKLLTSAFTSADGNL
ncbi:hypothetical protein AB0I10_11355 [Streptomyces sp. NPDC050636]|uniref:hypothetical protein n=1 Tax=Streptomyces sp. NPDC050636 TaxID=3154510 RepID=UPI00343F3DC7